MKRPFWALFLLTALSCPLAAQNSGFDERLFRSINSSQNPDQNGVFEYLDYSSLPSFVAVPVGFVLVGAIADNEQAAHAGLTSGIGQVTALGLTVLLKELVSRPRPFETLTDVRVKHQWSVAGSSFPSGHTSQAFAIATVISLKYGKAAVSLPMFLWAGAVGYGRIYLGLHYPSDVIGGILIGVASGFLAWSVRTHVSRVSGNIATPATERQPPPPGIRIISLRIPL